MPSWPGHSVSEQAGSLPSRLGGGSLPLRLSTQERVGPFLCRASSELAQCKSLVGSHSDRLTLRLIPQTAPVSRTRPENKQNIGL